MKVLIRTGKMYRSSIYSCLQTVLPRSSRFIRITPYNQSRGIFHNLQLRQLLRNIHRFTNNEKKGIKKSLCIKKTFELSCPTSHTTSTFSISPKSVVGTWWTCLPSKLPVNPRKLLVSEITYKVRHVKWVTDRQLTSILCYHKSTQDITKKITKGSKWRQKH